MVAAPANAAPAMPARLPSNRMRAVSSRAQSCDVAYERAISEARVRVPAAATPIRSSRQRVACKVTSGGRSANAIPRTNDATSGNAVAVSVAPRSSGIRASLNQAVGVKEALRNLLDCFFVDVHAGVQLGDVFVVELRGECVQRIGDPGI